MLLRAPGLGVRLLEHGRSLATWIEPLRLTCLDYPAERRRLVLELKEAPTTPHETEVAAQLLAVLDFERSHV